MKAKQKSRLTADVLDMLDSIVPGTLLYRAKTDYNTCTPRVMFVLEFSYDEHYIKLVAWDINKSGRCEYTQFMSSFLDMFTTDPERAWRYEQ